MRVLIAPDKFAGTLTAVQAARAIAEGWRDRAPDDEIDLAPVADGGPGFVDVLHEALGGDLVAVTVPGPLGDPVPATLLVVGDTAYIETAQACGLALGDPARAEAASTHGVGELIAAAVGAGVRRVVLGLGGSATTDGGAGLLGALGATADRALDAGPAGLAGVGRVDLGAARAAVAGVEIVAACDVTSPLTGLFGAAKTFGPQKGLAEERIPAVDAVLEAWAHATDRRRSLDEGAGAAGGLGFAVMLLGGRTTSGIDLVLGALDLPSRCARADVVVTGEGRFDFSSRAGKAPYGVAQAAASALRPCVVLAGEVLVGTREMRALGVEAAYSLVDEVGRERAIADSYEALMATARRAARNWSQ